MGDNEEFEVHPAFEGAGEKIGMEIWRIEQFEPVKQDPKNAGKFYNHDAYICLSTTQTPGKSKFDYNIHFWLGKYCAQDEAGTAAMRTVELDSGVLGGAGIQHREVQGHETKLFCSYFKGGVQYLEGGVESGFNKVDHDAYTKRLFQVKGKKNVRVEQVECKCGSLNQGDTFVLDDGKDIYVWIGPYSEKKEQMVGVEAARRIRDEEKGGRAHIHIVEDWDTNEEFYKALGSKDKTIKAAGDDDEELVRRLDQELMLYEISEAEEPTEEKWCNVYEVAARPLQQSMLNSDYCFVLDSGYSGLYLWTGSATSNEFKKKVWGAVNKFLSTRGYPDWVSVTRVIDGGETPLFKQYFESWTDESQENGEVEQESNVAEQDYSGAQSIDINEMHAKSESNKAEDWMPDAGDGEYTMWRINESLDLVEVPKKAHGAFFGEDCYVIQYQYEKNGTDQYIIYFWQGLKANNDQRAASAGHTVKLDDALGGQAVQIRVVMNKEPAHFLKLFKDRMVIFEGGSSAGYRGAHDYNNFNPNIPYMFDIRAKADGSVRAVQVEARGASLNSNSLFIIDSPKKLAVWVGKYSGEEEVELAKEMIAYTAGSRGDPAIISEGSEPVAFWDAIGGEEPYYTGPKETSSGVRIPPRLFQCSMISGRFTVDEIVHFEQEDLDENDVMLLDTYDEIFIWIGRTSREWEKQEAMKTAYLYLESDPTGRTPENTLIICLRQGFEPPQFTGCFHTWDNNMWSEGKTFKELMEEVGQENAGINLLEDEVKKYTSTYPLDVLQRTDPPEGVDPTKKEMYLSDEDFQDVFGMSKDDFLTYPQWKRDNMRKEHGLF